MLLFVKADESMKWQHRTLPWVDPVISFAVSELSNPAYQTVNKVVRLY